MTVSFNPQRPARASRNASPVQEAAAAAAAQPEAQAHQEPAPNLNPGVHRQTATQAALLAQLQHQAGAAPAQPRSESPVRAHADPSIEEIPSSASAVQTQTPRPQSREEYVAHWNAWAEAGGGTGGFRTEAVRKMTAWLDANDATAVLDISLMHLNSLPDALPDSLQYLNVSLNPLTRFPNSLPISLKALLARGIWLTHLPDSLPSTLQVLNVQHNRLTRLPEDITTQLSSACTVHLEGNPLSERVILALNSITGAPGYQGPRFVFSMAFHESAALVARPLADAAAAWFVGEERDAARQAWTHFQGEPYHAEFSKFLDRLGQTVNSSSARFRESTRQWLTQLAADDDLRQKTLLICDGATTSCEDRVSLALNDMKKARVAADVERGAYDDRWPDLLELARGMFRLDKLEIIARHKASTLRLIDEIEVYLAYQVKLRERLDLPVDTEDMKYFKVSNVTESDLDAAEASVRAAGPNELLDYLSIDWAPWAAVLIRWEPVRYQEAQARLHEVTENEFATRQAKRLKRSEEASLASDSDAQARTGREVMRDIQREILVPLTKSFLESQHLMGSLQALFSSPARDSRPPVQPGSQSNQS